ncbi:hypothetical protein KW805_02960 [Candidatus Pacearchaeota archaeon]|nr:hypothetical protein [Candidatus Pacearchaeota archaeon]
MRSCRGQTVGVIIFVALSIFSLLGIASATEISNFTFTGYVKNDSAYVNGTNVTIYGISDSPTAPPTTTALSSTLTNASGYFMLTNINTSAAFRGYRLSTIAYNNNIATQVGSILPDFPAPVFYGGFDSGAFDMSLNGGTFYMQPAVTINFNATNGTSQVSFGWELIDQALGYPVDGNFMAKITSGTLVVPANRAYTLSFFRMPSFFGTNFGFLFDPLGCDPNNASRRDLMNDTSCPASPKSATINITQAAPGSVVSMSQSLIMRKVSVHGCINIAPGANNSMVNITSIRLKMLPWTTAAGNFIPSRSADDGSSNSETQLSTIVNVTNGANHPLYGGCVAYYNISLLNGTGYMLEFYAKNASLGNAAANPGSANNLAAFQNITTIDNLQANITLYTLAGNYRNSSTGGVSINISMMKINIINSTGAAVTQNINANIKVKNRNTGTGTTIYIISPEDVVNGSFYFPLLNNSNYAKVMVFSSNSPPKEVNINTSASEVNITIKSLNSEKGFRKFEGNGTVHDVDTVSTPIQIRLLSRGGACDLPNAPTSCEVTSFNASGFNPLKAMLVGKVNMEIKITSTNVSIIYYDYDMMSAKQPPMDSIISENASGRMKPAGSAVKDTWNFGSFAPVDSYSNITLIMPYSDTTTSASYLNDSANVNISVPILYDENNNPTWNLTRGDSPSNLGEDFLEYNSSYYQSLVNTTSGFTASKTDNGAVAFLNTTGNYIALKIPHFSTIGALVSGSALADSTSGGSGSNSSSAGSSDSDSDSDSLIDVTTDGNRTFIANQTQLASGYSQYLYVSDKIQFTINSALHALQLMTLSSSQASIIVASTPQAAVLMLGQNQRFDLDNDGYYDVRITFNNVLGSRANITVLSIHEEINALTGSAITGAAIASDTTTATNSTGSALSKVSVLTTKWFWIIVLLLMLVIIGSIYYVYVYGNPFKKRQYEFI